MNSFSNFIHNSKQFKNLAKNMFNNNFKFDHFAYRSFNITPIINHYKSAGYTLENEKYNFPNNVSAHWLSHPTQPSLFVSQYDGIDADTSLNKLSPAERHYINSVIKGRDTLSYSCFKKLNDHNQYLAWTILFENKINHIAFLVPDIYKTVQEIGIRFPEYKLNNPNNPVQVSGDGELLQFSIKSDPITYMFNDGPQKVPFSFIEFVERKNGRRGFEGQNAAKIFESTKID